VTPDGQIAALEAARHTSARPSGTGGRRPGVSEREVGAFAPRGELRAGGAWPRITPETLHGAGARGGSREEP